MKRAKYICIEGVEGVGKTTQINKLVNELRSQGKSVLHTKEPGMPAIKETMNLRNLILNNNFSKDYLLVVKELENYMKNFVIEEVPTKLVNKALNDIIIRKEYTIMARELLIQAVRSMTLQYISENLRNYDYIIQDRGILSGICYGVIVGNHINFLLNSNNSLCIESCISKNGFYDIYDQIIHLKGDSKKGLDRATLKNEFKGGDFMESKGYDFIEKVSEEFDKNIKRFKSTNIILVDGLSIDEVFSKIMKDLP